MEKRSVCKRRERCDKGSAALAWPEVSLRQGRFRQHVDPFVISEIPLRGHPQQHLCLPDAFAEPTAHCRMMSTTKAGGDVHLLSRFLRHVINESGLQIPECQ